MMNKAIIAVVFVVLIGGVWKLQAIKIEALSTTNGTLVSEKAILKSSLESAEEDKKQADGRIKHLSRLFLELTESRSKARHDANKWRQKFNKEKLNDKICKDWSNTPLPACVIDRLFGSGSKASSGLQGSSRTGSSGAPKENIAP